ncbi:hypothetical protein LCL89_15970 [Halobacillus yeomjeoni]|uniref:hypothetical protein n=1 Tax=Halobacillus yeomjeoni TaxID=311194 RepID=UPI001CD253EF|nr:hypothetical protein [Halobacillus yeomjeoni]MCA0985534.1 hypothetical protein [Halobacillus yeomjeoni]
MREVILLLAELVNVWHDVLMEVTQALGWNLTDKDLHFWVIGILGIFGLLFVDVLFHYLAKLSITAISFLFAFTMMLVFVFAVEIQQKVTGRGNMEFADAVASIYGFLAFCSVYILIRLGIYGVKIFKQKRAQDTSA